MSQSETEVNFDLDELEEEFLDDDEEENVEENTAK